MRLPAAKCALCVSTPTSPFLADLEPTEHSPQPAQIERFGQLNVEDTLAVGRVGLEPTTTGL